MTVAIVGASNDRSKFGNKSLRAFQAEGHTVIPINPHEQHVEGVKAYGSVLDVPGPIDMATVYVQPEVGIALLDEFERKRIPEISDQSRRGERRVDGGSRSPGAEHHLRVQHCRHRTESEPIPVRRPVVTIRLRKNGPYVIESEDVRVIDWNGVEYAIDRRPIALCRCGASTRKPFCDGTHSKVGFAAGEAAAGPAAADAPAEP